MTKSIRQALVLGSLGVAGAVLVLDRLGIRPMRRGGPVIIALIVLCALWLLLYWSRGGDSD